jgi:hypothetical protein
MLQELNVEIHLFHIFKNQSIYVLMNANLESILIQQKNVYFVHNVPILKTVCFVIIIVVKKGFIYLISQPLTNVNNVLVNIQTAKFVQLIRQIFIVSNAMLKIFLIK